MDGSSEPDSAWPQLLSWAHEAPNSVEILPRTPRGDEELAALSALGVTERSPMGALVRQSAGILVDHRWLRLLGSGGGPTLSSICRWNGLLPGTQQLVPGGLVVGWDVVGGLFLVNDQMAPTGRGHVWFFEPDSLSWLDTQMAYSGFVRWTFHGPLDAFYSNLRWPGWEEAVQSIDADHGLHFYPPPWSKEGADPLAASRAVVPVSEILSVNLETMRQLERLGNPSTVRLSME